MRIAPTGAGQSERDFADQKAEASDIYMTLADVNPQPRESFIVGLCYGSESAMILRVSGYNLATQQYGYATMASKRPLRVKGPLLTLDHVRNLLPLSKPGSQVIDKYQFLQKKRALTLWRDIVRAINSMRSSHPPSSAGGSQDQGIPPSATREELRKYARGEFERNRNVTDIVSPLNATDITTLTFAASYPLLDLGERCRGRQ